MNLPLLRFVQSTLTPGIPPAPFPWPPAPLPSNLVQAFKDALLMYIGSNSPIPVIPVAKGVLPCSLEQHTQACMRAGSLPHLPWTQAVAAAAANTTPIACVRVIREIDSSSSEDCLTDNDSTTKIQHLRHKPDRPCLSCRAVVCELNAILVLMELVYARFRLEPCVHTRNMF